LEKAPASVGAFLLPKDDICNIGEVEVLSMYLYLVDILFLPYDITTCQNHR
jgi:hypothetical protein